MAEPAATPAALASAPPRKSAAGSTFRQGQEIAPPARSTLRPDQANPVPEDQGAQGGQRLAGLDRRKVRRQLWVQGPPRRRVARPVGQARPLGKLQGRGGLVEHRGRRPGQGLVLDDREMVEILSTVLQHDEQVVLEAVDLARAAGVPTKTHILNLLHRLIDGSPLSTPTVPAPAALA